MFEAASRVRRGGGAPGHESLPLERQRDGVHQADHGVTGHPVPLFEAEGQEPASDFGRDGDLRRFEVAVGVGLLAAAGGQDERGENEEPHGESLAVVGVSPRVVR